jgi:hypothetical protein
VALFIERLTRATDTVLYEPMTEVHQADPRPTLFALSMRRAAGLGCALFVACYIVFLSARALQPSSPECEAPRVSASDIETLLTELNLDAEWASQTPKAIEYADVFAEQASNYGALTRLNGKLVVWWGVLRLPVFDRQGRLARGQILLNARAGELGDARLPFVLDRNAEPLSGEWRDGQIILCVARLHYEERSLATPVLRVYHARHGMPSDALSSERSAESGIDPSAGAWPSWIAMSRRVEK